MAGSDYNKMGDELKKNMKQDIKNADAKSKSLKGK